MGFHSLWRIAVAACWLLAAGLSSGQAKKARAVEERNPTAADIREILNDLGKITGMAPKSQIPFTRMTRAQLREFTEKRLSQSVRPEELARQEKALKKFGLLPEGYRLREELLDLVTEQAAALYDEEKKRMVMLDVGGNVMMERIALIHELAHGLADQHIDLGKYIGWKRNPRTNKPDLNDDETLARQAVVEGQATWLMIEHSLFRMGQSLKTNPMIMNMIGSMSEGQMAAMPSLAKSPLYMREQLMFPYTAGLKFQQAVIEKTDKAAFLSVYEKPPATTQQVMHPELYFQNQLPTAVSPDPFPSGFETTLSGSVGEFDHQVLFRQFEVADAVNIAAGWRGGGFAFAEKGEANILSYASTWADEKAATAARTAYLAVMKAKWKRFSLMGVAVDVACGIGDDGGFRLRQNGEKLWVLQGLSEADVANLSDCRSVWKKEPLN